MIAFRNLYPNLPGHLVEFKDGGLALRVEANPPSTGSLLILGTAIDGPVMEPVAVDPATAEALFGKAVRGNGVPNGSTLIPAFEEAYNAGCRDIRLMRISGGESKATISATTINVVSQKVKNEFLGISKGNKQTVINLGNAPVVPSSLIVEAGGVQLLEGVNLNAGTGILTISSNKTDADVALSISYNYLETVTESHNADANLKVVLDNNIYVGSGGGVKSCKFGATDVAFTITGDNELTLEGVADGNQIDIIYVSVNEMEVSNEGSFRTDSETIIKTLDQRPVDGTVHLYGSSLELAADSFEIVNNNQVALFTAKIPKGLNLEITYAYNESLPNQTPSIDFSSIFGGIIYNQAKVKVEDIVDEDDAIIGKKVILTKPESKKFQIAEAPLEFSSLDYPTLQLMVQAINNHEKNNVFSASTKFSSGDSSTLIAIGDKNFAGGTDGVVMTTDQLFKALTGVRNSEGFIIQQGAFQLLEDYQVDYVVPVGVYADDEVSGTNANFAYQLALFCAVLSYRNKMTFGAIGMKPIQDTGLAALQEYGRYLAAYDNSYFMKDSVGNTLKDEQTGELIDLGGFINVVCGPEITVNGTSLGVYNTNAAVTYAAFSTTLNPQSAASNKALPGARGIRYRLSDAQLNDIVGNRFTVIKRKPNGQIITLDDITCAKPGSDYARRTTGKVVREVTDQIREVCDPFLGEPNTIEQRNAMSSLIEKRLGQLKTAGVIQRYEFQVIATVNDQLLGQAKIELTLVPPQELRKITTVVSLKPV